MKEQDKIQYELSGYEVLLIGNALSSYRETLQVKLTEWDVKNECKEMISIILKKNFRTRKEI